ncbi:Nn.00g054430.m01.CDS01 [Neocucurbitaria sp. VM-36]
MPAQTTCPISEVDRALAAYINSREETLRIRRTLSKYLTSSLRPVNAAIQNQHLNHECPHNSSAANTNPPGLKDIRLEYLYALRVRNQAQSRHRELQASLEALRDQHADQNPIQPESEYDNDLTRGYVSLLRQRRRYLELQVIQEAANKLLSTKPSNAPLDPRALVKDKIGEQPDLPAERLEHLSQTPEDQIGILRLKQEVLEARARMERAQADRKKADSESRGSTTLQDQVYALERARDEIVEWVQGELVKMEEDSIFLEDASPIKRTANIAAPMNLDSAEVRIQDSYDRYTSSRATLIGAIESLQQPPSVSTGNGTDNDSKDRTQSPDKSRDTFKPFMPINKILPHLPHLTHIAKSERSLLQQSVYLEAQMLTADRDIEEALLRLSGESHLLPAGTKDVAEWGRTAKAAEAATEEFVKEHMQASRQELSSVSAIVEICSLQSKVLASM